MILECAKWFAVVMQCGTASFLVVSTVADFDPPVMTPLVLLSAAALVFNLIRIAHFEARVLRSR